MKKKTNENRESYSINGKRFNAKINLDKYYTPVELAKYCIDKTYEIIGKENITEIIEPSAGNGSFSLQIPNCIAYDIEPEHESIIKQDFFELNLPYKKGRLIIGNPPFGMRGNLITSFFKKSIQLGEYIAFILPASQYKNNYKYYEYDLIYSELIDNDFENLDKNIKLTFNIYKRPINGFNKRRKYKFEDFELYEQRMVNNEKRAKLYKNDDYDFRILTWGGTVETCGRILKPDEHYANEVAFYIHNEDLKEPIRKLFENNNITKEYYMTSTPNITLWMIYEYILKYIPNLK
jgi:predicted RNA methylase